MIKLKAQNTKRFIMDGKTPASDPTSKSTAVVQYSSVKFPVHFSTIRLNTDLKQPPAGETAKDRHEKTKQYSPFHSLNMASAYQDLVGSVDVISASKNIKQLLKLPYSGSPQVSLIVHRLRKTILLEEFDITKNILRNESKEWGLLRDYFNKIIAQGDKQEEDRMKCLVSAAKRDPSTENMYINLIRHSFAAASIGDVPYTMMEAGDHSKKVNSLPEPSEEDLRGFHHESLWTFEDISMLIDSDLPIFGSGSTKRPCISLRLRDSRSPPINVLTGLDYWLDNLMSNVPEVAMCYHIDGFVQKYEVFRTEDIPELDNSKFDPQIVMDIARNIMAFIKAHAVVEGHTYWLYKGENDDMVKLYNLTDHCKDEISVDDNPFTVPVGLLCYRLGYNLKSSNQKRQADARAMFESCLRLLDETKHSQICANAHFHLSDMWVPDRSVNDIWSEKGKLSEPPSDLYEEESNSEDSLEARGGASFEQAMQGMKALVDSEASEEGKSEPSIFGSPNTALLEAKSETKKVNAKQGKSTNQTDSNREEAMKNEVALRELVVRGMIKHKAWGMVQSCRIAGETDERCKMALGHIRKGLNCADKDQARGKNIGLVEPQQTCSPFEAIPMHYSPLKPQKESSVDGLYPDLDVVPIISNECQQMCSPDKAIPLHYQPLRSRTDPQNLETDKQSSETTTEDSLPKESSSQASQIAEAQSTASSNSSAKSRFHLTDFAPADGSGKEASSGEESSSTQSWHAHAKFVLLRKAVITYFVLAKSFYGIRKYGHTLRHLRYAFHCYECLAEIDADFEETDPSMREVYYLMTYLTAETRISLNNANWIACHKEFEELGEEEAAILSSAQCFVTTPKNLNIYEWSKSLEDNHITAGELLSQCMNSKDFEKKPHDLRAEIKQNYALSWFLLGNMYQESCKDKITYKKESLETAMPLWEKTMDTYQTCVKAFEAANDKNTIAHVYSNIANQYILAGNACLFIGTDPIPKESRKYYDKAVEYYERSLDFLERQEQMDPVRESTYASLRSLYCHLSMRFINLLPDHCTDEQLVEMKELIQKSLSYCHLDSATKDLASHQTFAALNHVNLASVYVQETKKFKSALRRKNLYQKAEDSHETAFYIYSKLRWHRPQIFVKVKLIQNMLQNPLNGNLNVSTKKKQLRAMLQHLCELQPITQSLLDNDPDIPTEQQGGMYDTELKPMKDIISNLNAVFMCYLKLDKGCAGVKEVYQRCLRLTALTSVQDIYPPLNALLIDLKKFLTSEPS